MTANITKTLQEEKEQAIREGLEKGLEEGLEKGLEKGIKEGVYKVARALLDVLDDETIAIKTGLTKEEVQELRTKN